jgi:hypothetical protein
VASLTAALAQSHQAQAQLIASHTTAQQSLTKQMAKMEEQLIRLSGSLPPSTPSFTSPSSVPNPMRPQLTSPAQAYEPAPPAPAHSAPASAPVLSAPAPPTTPRPKRVPLLRQRTVEPNDANLHAVGLPRESPTDLIIAVEYAPKGNTSMSRRTFFPNHITSPKDTCFAVGKALQDPQSLSIAPPRIPSFLMKANSLTTTALAALLESLQPASREHEYLQAWILANECGDEFDLLSHRFAAAECVQGWASLLTNTTQAYKPPLGGAQDTEGRFVHIRLGFSHPMVMEAARTTFANHAARIHELARHVSPVPTGVPPFSPLSQGARLSTVTVSPFRLRYTCTTVTNWPREHPTELCGGNNQLDAFLRLHAPDLRVLTSDLYGQTNPQTMVICQQEHLSQLLTLRGKTSPEHGISTPLNLHCNVQLMGTQTCTFCWTAGHTATRCPRNASGTNPIAPTSDQPACRFCYSFDHHAARCREAAPVTCKLCESVGHATFACSHFKRNSRALADYLKPRSEPNPRLAHQQAAPILSAAQQASQHAWQSNSPPNTAPLPGPSAAYVTLEQLQLALAPFAGLQNLVLQLAPLLALQSSLTTPAMPAHALSSLSLLHGQ